MKIFKVLFVTFVLISLSSEKRYSAEKDKTFDGEGGREDLSFLNVKNSNYKKGIDALKRASKFEKKSKLKKANNYFEKALKYFVLAHREFPENIDILNYLGFTYYKVGDLVMSEIYYQEALTIDPKNPIINQRLGELYINTKRINLAKERLKSLSICNCQEYLNLKNIIEKN